MTPKEQLDIIEEHLDRETEILRLGRIDELGSLLEDREELIKTLNALDADPRRLSALRSKAETNASLLRACEDGVRKALNRLLELQKMSGPIASYSAGGAPSEIGTMSPEFERKA